jgi:hypothetical protein
MNLLAKKKGEASILKYVSNTTQRTADNNGKWYMIVLHKTSNNNHSLMM